MRAEYWRYDGDCVVCGLCPHVCRLDEGQSGLCGARRNAGGVLESLNYGEIAALALDPIEKKPLREFFPGSLILSAGSWGCNLGCRFCQNWRIARVRPPVRNMTAVDLARVAKEAVAQGSIGLAYTYAEPLVCYEFTKECARLCRDAGLKNVLVSNGYINRAPLLALAPYLDAANIDLKAFDDGFYRRLCGGSLEPVKQTIRLLADYCHVEVTVLIVPGENDSAEEMAELAGWLAQVDKALPLHISRYFPCYLMTAAATPPELIYSLKKTAEKFLTNVYTGNI